MTIKSELETASEHVRKALIATLEKKSDYHLTELFTMLKDLKKLSNSYYEKPNDVIIGSRDSLWDDDGISITGMPGGVASDTISFSSTSPGTVYTFS